MKVDLSIDLTIIIISILIYLLLRAFRVDLIELFSNVGEQLSALFIFFAGIIGPHYTQDQNFFIGSSIILMVFVFILFLYFKDKPFNVPVTFSSIFVAFFIGGYFLVFKREGKNSQKVSNENNEEADDNDQDDDDDNDDDDEAD